MMAQLALVRGTRELNKIGHYATLGRLATGSCTTAALPARTAGVGAAHALVDGLLHHST
jgi:hypothetical protein